MDILDHRVDERSGRVEYLVRLHRPPGSTVLLRPRWKTSDEVNPIARDRYVQRIGRDPEWHSGNHAAPMTAMPSRPSRKRKHHEHVVMEHMDLMTRCMPAPSLQGLPPEIFHGHISSLLNDNSALALSRVNRDTQESFIRNPHPLRQRFLRGRQTPREWQPYPPPSWRVTSQRDSTGPMRMANLELGLGFDERLSRDSIVSRAQKLILGAAFNTPIEPGDLPEGLLHLEFRAAVYEISPTFNQPLVSGSLPGSLTYLSFGGGQFNQVIAVGVLPVSLKTLSLSASFNQPLAPGALPPNLTELSFGMRYDHPIERGVLPPRLFHLDFHPNSRFNNQIEVGALPSSLRELYFGTHLDREFEVGVLPGGLVLIQFPAYFNQPIHANQLPSTLERITFGRRYNKKIRPGVLPASLKRIEFGRDFNQPLDRGVFPDQMEIIRFNRHFVHPVQPGVIPQSVQVLSFGRQFMRNYASGDSVLQLTDSQRDGDSAIAIREIYGFDMDQDSDIEIDEGIIDAEIDDQVDDAMEEGEE